MIEAAVVFAYLAIVLYMGIFAFRRHRGTGEDYFLASRSLGPTVFLFSLFGTNMTAFSILGSSGKTFQDGIGVYGLMASSSGLIIPLTLLFVGTRLWAVGKRFGHMTPVQIFRDRWEAGHIGTLIFVLQAALLVPYIVVGVMGGGKTLHALSSGQIPEAVGGGVVALVVMSYVFCGGMRGTAWVNTFQTILFLTFGVLALVVIGNSLGGFSSTLNRMLEDEATAHLLSREHMNAYVFFSFMFIPLSAIAFPHICIFCLTAKKVESFKYTVILYPVCILAIWLPCVFLGMIAASDASIQDTVQAAGSSDHVMLLVLKQHAPRWLTGILGAAIMAAVMASDSQILALSTMFTEDIFAYYGGKKLFGEKVQVVTGRIFVIVVTAVAYVIAMTTHQQIFDIAIKYAFTGYAALAPLTIAAVFWKRGTKYGALASTLVVIGGLLLIAYLEAAYPETGSIPGLPLLTRTPGGVVFFRGLLPVVPLVLLSTLAMIIVSLLTPPPSRRTVERYFPSGVSS